MRRLVIKQGERTYRFLQHELRDHADGSLTIMFDRREEKGPLRVSYHATGRVNFHRDKNHVAIFCEPVFAISGLQAIFLVRLPSIEKLTELKATEGRADDMVLEVPPEINGRVALEVTLVPNGLVTPQFGAVIDYEGWFDIAVSMMTDREPVPAELGQHVITMYPAVGQFETQACQQDSALIFVHRKRTGANGLICYFDPVKAVYRLIFAVPMRAAPNPSILFHDPSVVAEYIPLPKNRQHLGNVELNFKAKGKGGYLKSEQAIVRIFLDVEL